MEIVLVFAAFMIPAAIVWVVTYLLVRRSKTKRIALFLIFYLGIGLSVGFLSVLFAHVWLPGTLLTIGLFEWALARKPQ